MVFWPFWRRLQRRSDERSANRRRHEAHARLHFENLEERLLLAIPGNPVMMLLNSNAPKTIVVSDNGSLQVDGGPLLVDSKSAKAATVSGSGLIRAGEFDVVGVPGTTVAGRGTIAAPIQVGITPQPDPLLALPKPGQASPIRRTSEYTKDLYPGAYLRGINISGKATVTLHPGIYYVKGGLALSGDATVLGDGVMIYVSPGKNEDGLEISGHATLSISPPTEGTYQGISIFQARSAHEEIEVKEGGVLNLTGTIYAATGTLEVTDNGTINRGSESVHFIGSRFIGGKANISGKAAVHLGAADSNSLALQANLTPPPRMLADGTLVTAVRNSTIVGTSSPMATITLEIDRESAVDSESTTADSAGNFNLPVTLLRGPNTVRIRAALGGQSASETIPVTLDELAPTIRVSSPNPGSVADHNVATVGQVADDLSGVASLQAAIDGGVFAPISVGADGIFDFTTNLPLDHSADGPHTEHLKATDNAGNVAQLDVSFILDTTAPTIHVSTPSAGSVANHTVAVTGQVVDDSAGVASLQAALDGDSFAAVTLGGDGAFDITTNLPLDHTADGQHIEHLKATDNAGNVSLVDVSFTLDTTAPTIRVNTPSPGSVTNHNVAVTGQVVDDRSGVASLQAALDGGSLAAVSLGADGTFNFGTNLLLDHTADGLHIEHLKATDEAGNVTFVDFTFTIDTLAPSIQVTSPSGVITNPNVTAVGQVTDDGSGVRSLLAALDDGNFDTITVASAGSFNFAIVPALDHSADGPHTEHFRATDNAGNVSLFDVTFNLQSAVVAIDFGLDPAFDTPPLGDGHTLADTVTLQGTTKPSSIVQLRETGAIGNSDENGMFSFEGVALSPGDNNFTVLATDQAGNTGTAQHVITRDSAFGSRLIEGTRFLTSLDQSFIVPDQPSVLEFQFTELHFDTHANFVKDAFEASLTDSTGNSLVLPIAGSRDAFFNISEGQSPALSSNARLTGDTVDLDLSHIAAGTEARLRVRLVNNDADTTTSVSVTEAKLIAGTMNTPSAATLAQTPAFPMGNVDLSTLADITSSMAVTYSQSSLNEQTDVLYADLTLQNAGTYPVDSPVVAVITHLSDPTVNVRNSDGLTPDRSPYLDLSGLIGGRTLAAGQSTGTRTLAFYNPKGVQFTYELVVLGHLNRPPAFDSAPNTEAIEGTTYVYQAAAGDSDNDALTFTLVTGPDGMTVDPATGEVTWQPELSDLGNQAVLLQVDDGHGGVAQQQYTLETITAPPNRPPLFASVPVVSSNVNAAYTYHATATDPDADAIAFSLVSGPAGMSVVAGTGLVSWTPTADQMGIVDITLAVSDGRGGTATQVYRVHVLQDPKNSPPLIVSDPITQYNIPPVSDSPAGNVNPERIQLTLSDGQISDQTVSLTGLSGGPLTLGSPVTGIFGTPGQQDAYTFSLANNALLYFDSLTNNAGFQWSLVGPNSFANVSNRPFTASDTGIVPNPVLNLPAGAYILTVAGTGQTAGLYGFRLSNLASVTALTPSASAVSAVLNPANRSDLYRFDAVLGQSFYFGSSKLSGGTSGDQWLLIDPYGNVVSAISLGNDAGRMTLRGAGSYTVIVQGDIVDTGTVSYSLTLAPITNTVQALTLGSAVNANLGPGQQDSYTFDLAASALVYFDALTNNSGLQWSLAGPGGTAVSNRSFTASDGRFIATNPVLALPAGAYTLTVSGVGQTSGPYAFRLLNLAVASALAPNTTINDSLNPANGTILYAFTANAGDRYTFVGQGGTTSQFWRLIDPYGNAVASGFLASNLGPVSLVATGTYTLLVEGFIADSETSNYSFTAQFQGNTPPSAPGATPLILGNSVNGVISAPGQQDRYSFDLSANSLLYFDALTANDNSAWSLAGPGGTVISNRQFTTSDGSGVSNPALSLPAGTYLLTVAGLFGQAPGAYAFRMLNLAMATAVTPGAPITDSLNPRNSTNAYRFDASAGQSFYFARLSTTGSVFGDSWRLIDPYGNTLFSRSLDNDGGRQKFIADGSYTVLVEGSIRNSGTLSYALNVTPITDTTEPLVLGTATGGTLATPGQQDRYTFTLAAAGLVYFDSLTNNINFAWSLVGPVGTAVNNRAFDGSDGRSISVNPVLPLPAGSYTLTVTGNGQTTGTYSFRLSDLANATPSTPGMAVSDTLNPGNATNLYQFSAAAGQTLYFAHLSGNAPWWRLIDPYGNMLFSTLLSNDGGRLTLGAAGNYTVLVEGDITSTGTSRYSFNAAAITDKTQALTLGSDVTGTLSAPGEQDRYTLTLPGDTQLDFDSLTNNGNFQWSLIGPAGTAAKNVRFDFSDSRSSTNPVLPLPAGVYTLTVSATGSTTGTYSFRLSDLAAATPLTPGTTASATLNPGNRADMYQFSAAAGQSFYFAHLSGNGPTWRLIDPVGTTLFNTSFSNDGGRMTLGVSGTYTVLIDGDITSTGPIAYSFNVVPITDKTQGLTLGNVVSSGLAAPGELDNYTLSLANSALLYFDSLTNSSNLQWSLSGPAGIAVNNRPFTASDGLFTANPVLAIPAGNYTLTVSASGQTTGTYSFRLSDLATASAVVPGTPVSGTLSPANSTSLYQFSGSAGDQFTFTRQGGSPTLNADWKLVDPYGNILFNAGLGSNVGPITVSAAGTYFLLIEGGVQDTGIVTYTVNVQLVGNVPPAFGGTSLTLGNTVTGNLAAAGQQDAYIFTLPASAQLYFDSLTNTQNLLWSLRGPAGTAVSGRAFASSDGPSTGLNPVLSLPAGNYTLSVVGSAGATGAYSFRLSDLAAAGAANPLMPGTAVGGTLNPANSTDYYSFAASAGQSFYFASIGAGSGSFLDDWRLVGPYGNILFNKALSSDAGRLTLNATGIYTVLVEGIISNSGTTSYAFNVEPINDNTQTLTLGNTVNATLAVPGQQDRYTFHLATSSQLYFDSLTNNANFQWSLKGPSGTLVSNRPLNSSDGNNGPSSPVLLLPAGDYSLTVLGSANTTGAYAFRVLDLAGAALLDTNTAIGGRLSPGNSTNIHEFNATAGDSYYFSSTTIPYVLTPFNVGSINTGQWRLIDRYGNVFFSTRLGSDAGRLTLPVTGTYRVLVEGAIGNHADIGYSLNVDRPEVNVIASDSNVPFENQSGAITNLAAPQFDVQMQGNGQPQVYNVDFIAPATGIRLGSIPVSINAQYRYQVRAVDSDGDSLIYQLTQAPAGMQLDPATGLITWVPTAAQVGANEVSVRVEDDHGGVDTQRFVVNVVGLAPGTIQGAFFNDQNKDGDRSSTTTNPIPANGPFQPVGSPFPAIGVDSGPAIILTIGPNGVISMTLTGQGPYDGEDDTYVAVVNQANSGIAVHSMQLTGNDNIFGFEGDGIGGDGATGYEGPGTFFTNSNGTAAQTVGHEGAVGTNNGTVNFDDGLGNDLQPGQQTFFGLEGVPTAVIAVIVKQVVPVTIEPALAGWKVYLDLNNNGSFDAGEPSTVTDDLGHYSFSNVAPGLYAVAEVGQPGWRQTMPASGSYTATVHSGLVTDGLDFGNVQLSTATERKPTITSVAPSTGVVNQRYEYTVAVSNPDAVDLNFDLPVKPDGMVIDAQTGGIVWYPTPAEVGPQDVIVRLKDDRGDVVLQHFQVSVSLEAPPVITSRPPEPAVSGLPYRYQVLAQDPENDPLTYSLTQAPDGMTIAGNSGLISWVAAPIGPGLPSGYKVTVHVSDGRGGLDTQTFTLQVVAATANQAPVIESSPGTSVGLGHRYLYAVRASDPDGDPLTYALGNAPAGMTIDTAGIVRWTPTPNQFGPNSVTVRVEDGRGGVIDQPFTVSVTTQTTGQPPIITTTPRAAATLAREYSYDAAGIDPGGTPLVWSLDAAPSGMSIDPLQGRLRWTPTADQLGSQQVIVRLTNGDGLATSQAYSIIVRAINVPPLITSNPSTQAAAGQAYTYNIAASDADNDPLTFSLTTAANGMTIASSTGLIHWTPTVAQIGTQDVTVLVDDGQGGTATQTWSVVVTSVPINHPPTITSTPPLAPPSGMPYQYAVLATDPDGQSVGFSLVAAPANMTIDPVSGLIQWTPTLAQLGNNRITVAATDPQGLSALQSFSIVVVLGNSSPVISSAPPVAVTVGQTYHYDVRATDADGDRLGYTLTNAPSGMAIDDRGRMTWSPRTGDIGSQPVEIRVDDGRGGTASQSFTILVSADTEAPQIEIELSANPSELGAPLTVAVSATDNVGIAELTLTQNGVAIALDAAGRANFTPATAGSFTLIANARDAAGNVGTDTQALVVVDPHDVAAPDVELVSPADGALISSPVDVVGSVNDDNLLFYTLSVAPVGTDTFAEFARGTTTVTNGILGQFDPTMLANDSYVLRLTAVDAGGHTSIDEQTVNVFGDLKLGNFTLSFEDLSIPVTGIPITVTRTYDTLNANQPGDFGFGWRLEFRDVQLRTSVAKTGNEADGFFNPFRVKSRVYVTLPGEERQGFTFEPKVAAGLRGSFIGIFEPKFVPDPGIKSSLTVTPADLRIDADGTVRDFETGLAYNPTDPNFGGSYLLTTKDGIAYDIDGFTGQVTMVSDTHNNTLTFSDTGIASSTGSGITFERDARGRIAAVIDPLGNRIRYQYDANGDLVAVTDRTSNTTQFVYRTSPAHYLDKVIDPLGRAGLRTDYDTQGRLIQIVDIAGNTSQLTFSASNSIETIKDPLGNQTTFEYDDRGNTVTKIDALGGITRSTYDADNNMLSRTDPLGRIHTFTYDSRGDVLTRTDPLGNTTISTYQAFTFFTTALAASRGQAAAPFTRLTSFTDPLGNTTAYTEDFFGAYTSVTDPLGHTISAPADNNGLIRTASDAAGNTRQFTYDSAGRPVLSIDPLGNALASTYDANGNPLTATFTLTTAGGTVRTVTTATAYDAQDRLVAFTDAKGGITRTEYDAAGNRTATIDQLGRRTKYVYDEQNRLIETIEPDDTPSNDSDNPRTRAEYDADGRQIAMIDELGRRTEYQYDALGRIVKTTSPDGSFTRREYDAAGQLTAEIDERGNHTEYEYDAAGRRIVTRDASGKETVSSYDASGKLTARTDPLGNRTTYDYDPLGRATVTRYADGSTTQTTYDERGLVSAQTDQLGKTTRYDYDADRRLTKITDALGNQTTYTYDEMGNQLTSTTTQTAADCSVRNVTSRKDYDERGRVIASTDPEGGVTRWEYDLSGTTTAMIDPLSRHTTYVHNARDQLIETIYPDATPNDATDNPRTKNQYDAAGQLVASIDEAGRATNFQYDTRGRLVKTIYPDGMFTRTEFDPAGNVTAQIDERGNRIEYEYDADNRLTKARDALRNITSFGYDADGRMISQTDALNHTTQFVYDQVGNRVETDYTDGAKTTSTYDLRGQVIDTTDQLGRTSHEERDALGRVTAHVDALGQRTEFTYDESGHLLRRKDANGHVTMFEYDRLGRQTAIQLPPLPGQQPLRSITQYDVDGNVLNTTDYNGNTITYTYDERNRMLVKAYPDGTSRTFTYTLTGLPATATDTRGTTQYSYDLRNRLLSRTDPDGTQISYLYDAAGDRTAVTTPTGITTYAFDALNRQSSVTAPDGGITRYTYDPAGNLIRTVMPNGTVESRSYDALNQLIFLENRDALGAVIFSYTYVLGPTERVDAVIEDAGRRVDYSYDALDRLKEEKITDAALGNRTIDYTYDLVGNRLTMSDSTGDVTAYSYDAMDRLTTETLGNITTQYTYDKNGNTLSRISPANTALYTWDFDNRLITADTNGDGTIDERNAYDASGNRVSVTVSGQETRFLIDTVHRHTQVVLEYAPGGAIQTIYVYGRHLLSQSQGGVQSYYEVDRLGSTRALTNASGVVTDRYIYDAFGNIIFHSGSTLNSYLFAGEQTDATTGLHYLRARYYDSSLGRLTSADPLRQSTAATLATLQFYVYTGNDPVNKIDPSGMFPTLAQLGIAGTVAGFIAAALDIYSHVTRMLKAGATGLEAFLSAVYLTTAPVLAPGTTNQEPGGMEVQIYNQVTSGDPVQIASGVLKAFSFAAGGLASFRGMRGGLARGPFTSAPEVAPPPLDPAELRNYEFASSASGEPVAVKGPGPVGQAPVEFGPDPVTGETAAYVYLDSDFYVQKTYEQQIKFLRGIQADNLIVVKKVDLGYFKHGTNPIPNVPYTVGDVLEWIGVGNEEFLAAIERQGGFDRVSEVTFIHVEGDQIVAAEGPLDVTPDFADPPVNPNCATCPAPDPFGNTDPHPHPPGPGVDTPVAGD